MPAGKIIIELKKTSRDKFSQLTTFSYDSAARTAGERRLGILERAQSCVVGWQTRYVQFRDAQFQVREILATENGEYGKRKGTIINMPKELDKMRSAALVFKLEVQRQEMEAEEKERKRRAKARGKKPEPKVKAAKPKKERTADGAAPGKLDDAATLHLLVKGNPCREKTNAADIYAKLKDGMTVADFVKAGIGHAKWNMKGAITYFAKKGFITVKEV